ncbi:hypothetical protein E0H73_41050 [Kribbella pittospori]|uniref:Uncharacterized protein n=1 Tax=Kribbella pittospori TaxID=722689 RepID=A0A4R0JXV6_9ACTN|nr:hypothetical protein [Kribbella pittospori]TCC51507.1 hypothetical protein E0H73_41050 [Kribbella pittospori]
MTLSVLAGFFGGLLLLVAAVGGGFELRELKVPKVTAVGRLVSAVVGITLVFVAIMVSPVVAQSDEASRSIVPDSQTEAHAPSAAAETPTSIDFTIQDVLGEDQITEQVKVQVDDRVVGTLTVDVAHPTATLTVTVLKPGTHTYILSSLSTFDYEGEMVEVPGSGDGQLDVSAGKLFKLRYEFGEEELMLRLE